MSSEGMLGAVKLEKDFAADFRAFREAVRFDLKLEFFFTVFVALGVKFGIMVSSECAEEGRSGWLSTHCSVGGETTCFSTLIAVVRRLRKDGVEGPLLRVDAVLWAGSRDGVVEVIDSAIESLDTERDDRNSPSFSSSISAKLSLSSSPAGSRRMSNCDRKGSDEDGLLSSLHS
jgi:hypothetical protein